MAQLNNKNSTSAHIQINRRSEHNQSCMFYLTVGIQREINTFEKLLNVTERKMYKANGPEGCQGFGKFLRPNHRKLASNLLAEKLMQVGLDFR